MSTVRVRSLEKFTIIPNSLVETHLRDIGAQAFALYCVLKKFADYTTGDCYPKVSTIAEMMGASRKTVERCLKTLTDHELLTKISGKEKGECNTYVIGYGGTNLGEGYPKNVAPPTPKMSHPNKEELEPLNDNQLTLSPPSSEGSSSKRQNQDSRYKTFIEILSTGYKQKGWDFGWDSRSGQQLKTLLTSRPKLDEQTFRLWLKNYFKSTGVIPGDMPHIYLSKLPRYWKGPLDQFGKLSTTAETVATVEEANRIYEQ